MADSGNGGRIRKTIRQGVSFAKKSAIYAGLCLSAALLAVILSILFSVEQVTEAGAMPEGGIAVVWKPAYLFSLPSEGDLVVCRLDAGTSDPGGLTAVFYDSSRVRMEQIRGKVIFRTG